MSSLNKVQLIGNCGADPEVRNLPNGGKVVTVSIATSDRWTDKATGEKKERTEWHRVVIFSEGLVKVAEQYLKKGSKVYLEGELRTRKWQDQAGADKYSTEVVLQSFNSSMVLLDSQPGGNRPPPPSGADEYGRSTTRDSVGTSAPETVGGLDDEIPF